MLFWNNQPSGNLFGNTQAQNQSFSGRLFSPDNNQSSHFSWANSFQSHSVSTGVPIYGTVDYMAKSHIHHIHENRQLEQYTCITGTILGCSLEELRIQDYFNLKRNLLPEWKQSLLKIVRIRSGDKRNNKSNLFFNKPEPEAEHQERKTPPMENSVRIQGRLDKQASASSSPGSFSFELNKMVFTSSFVSLLQKHKMSIPENLLDHTDFMPQLFKFLEHYNVNPPTENIPKFALNALTPLLSQSSAPVVQPQTSSAAIGMRKTEQPFKRLFSKMSKKEKLCKTLAPEKEVPLEAIDSKNSLPVVESRSNFGKAEEEEKGETQHKKGEVQKEKLKNEDATKKQEENVVESSEKIDEGNKNLSVGSSEETLSYEEVISIPKSD